MKSRSPQPVRQDDAFTFVEVFAAMIFLAILVPAIVEGLSIANRTSVVAERGSIAGELAENKLNEMLVGNQWETVTSTNKGDFGADWPGYSWQLSQTTWPQDTINTMTQLDVEVFYSVQGLERSFKISTMVSGSAQASGSGQSTGPSSSL